MPLPKVDDEAVEHQQYEKSGTPFRRTSSATSATQHDEHGRTQQQRRQSSRQPSVAALLRNPLAGMSETEVLKDVDTFIDSRGLQDQRDTFHKGALLARVQQREDGFEYVDTISEDEKEILRRERTHRWSQPFKLYFLVVLCAGSAIVQGMDQTGMCTPFTDLDRMKVLTSSSCQWCTGILFRRVWYHK